jgi:hypothetical protein
MYNSTILRSAFEVTDGVSAAGADVRGMAFEPCRRLVRHTAIEPMGLA